MSLVVVGLLVEHGLAPRPRALRDPVEDDPEQDDRDARGEALAEVLGLGEAGDDVVAQRAGADEAADDDHREDEDDPLVRREQERRPGDRQLDLPEQLGARRARTTSRGLDDRRGDAADAGLDEADDRRDARR